jgi:hypothetical protein
MLDRIKILPLQKDTSENWGLGTDHGLWRQCTWVGKKNQCASHRRHTCSTPVNEDKDVRASAADARDRRRFKKKGLTTVAAFVGSTDLSFRNASGDVRFKFVSDLIDLGISIPREAGTTVRASDLLDRFAEKAVRTKMVEFADLKFEACLA